MWLSQLALELIEGLPVFAGSPWLLTADGGHPCTNHGYNRRRLDALILEARRAAAAGAPEGAEPMPEWWVHDLRRTAATGMQRLGVRLEAVEAALGHVSGSRAGVVGIYQRHRFDEEARGALARWGDHIARLLNDLPRGQVVPLRQSA